MNPANCVFLTAVFFSTYLNDFIIVFANCQKYYQMADNCNVSDTPSSDFLWTWHRFQSKWAGILHVCFYFCDETP